MDFILLVWIVIKSAPPSLHLISISKNMVRTVCGAKVYIIIISIHSLCNPFLISRHGIWI